MFVCYIYKIAEGYTLKWSEDVFMTYNVKNIVIWTYVIGDLNGEETTGTFYEKELQNTRDRDAKVPNFFQ